MYVTEVRGTIPSLMPVNGSATSTTAPSTGNPIHKSGTKMSFQMDCAAAATCIIEVTNDPDTASGTNSNWITMGTITLAGAGSDGFTTNAMWSWVRARVTVASATTVVYVCY